MVGPGEGTEVAALVRSLQGPCAAFRPAHPQRELEPGMDNLFGAQSLAPSQRWAVGAA